MKEKITIEYDLLYKYIFEDNYSYEYIGKLYGCSGNAIRKRAIKLGITLPKRREISLNESFNSGHSKYIEHPCKFCGKNTSYRQVFCSLKCFHAYNRKIKYQEYLTNPNKYAKIIDYNWLKPIILKEQGNKCSICGIPNKWNNKPLTFILDHIDGRASNNNRNNLRLICSNCDSQLDTYKSKNKNSDRKDRYK